MFDPDTGEPARRVDEDLFTDVLIDAMTEAIKDRSSAASYAHDTMKSLKPTGVRNPTAYRSSYR